MHAEKRNKNSSIIHIDVEPSWGPYPDGHDLGDGYVVGKYRLIYYDLAAPFANLVGDRAVCSAWQFSRSSKEYHNECIAVSFIKHFDISEEDFRKANEEVRLIGERLGYPQGTSVHFEIYGCSFCAPQVFIRKRRIQLSQ